MELRINGQDKLLTDAAANTAAIATNTTNIGDLAYTENNYITDSEPLTESVDKLDMAVNDNAAQISQLDADHTIKIATVENELNTCKSVLSNININNEATQTATGYGVVSLPKNAANGHMGVKVEGVTTDGVSTQTPLRVKSVGKNELDVRKIEVDLFNLVDSFNVVGDAIQVTTSSVINYTYAQTKKIKLKPNTAYYIGCNSVKTPTDSTCGLSVKDAANTTISLLDRANGKNPSGTFTTPASGEIKLRFMGSGGTRAAGTVTFSSITLTEGSTATAYEPYKESSLYLPDVGVLRSLEAVADELTATEHIKRINDDGAALATPIITPIQSSGTLVSYPSGTVYVEKAIADAGIYDSGITVLNTDKPISTLESLSKIDFATGQPTPLDASTAVIAGDGLSFTHTGLSDGDIVFFTYLYDEESTEGEATVTYYDSRYVIEDSVNSKFYKWAITSANGVPSIGLVEV